MGVVSKGVRLKLGEKTSVVLLRTFGLVLEAEIIDAREKYAA
jgi:hypothetical protein